MQTSPHIKLPLSVRAVMLKVLLALLPAIAVYVWFFGTAIVLQLALASITALAAEALVLALRGKPLGQPLSDGSALVTAWLIALAFPPLVPWWLTVSATLIAIVIAKHLYGGLGQNPFNPAMVAFCTMIIAFPQQMSQWPGATPVPLDSVIDIIFAGQRQLDAVVMATPLDALRTLLREPQGQASISSLLGTHINFGSLGGPGWEWIALGYLLGGLWLLQQRVMTWHVPVAFLLTLSLLALIFSSANPTSYPGVGFHLFTGGTMLGAFFIATDPVSGCTTPYGKLIFAAGAAFLTWIIRSYGGYPDGIAFAILLMNMFAPLIDMGTQPRVFGHQPAARQQDKP